MKKIKLTKNKFALVDDDLFDFLNQWHWHYNRNGYAMRNGMLMHRQILKNVKEVDHKNGNLLDNRLSNLRSCSHSQNCFNRIKSQNRSSRFKGVGFHSASSKWQAYIKINGLMKHLGLFKSQIEAAIVYNKNAKKLFGEFAKLNIINY